MPEDRESILEAFAAEATRLGADELELECDDGKDHIYALKGGSGFSMASLSWSTALRKELSAITTRKRVIVVDGVKVELRATSFDSFGETAYRLKLRRVDEVSPRKKR
jgi:hypothetical protein